VETVAMIQGTKEVEQPIGGNSVWLLGFNEPDVPGFARQTPAEAAKNWHRVEELHPDRLLVSPAPGSWEVYDARHWLQDFRSAYIAAYGRPPRLDALAVHTYFSYAQDAINRVNEAIELAKEWGARGVWVTEFGMPWGEATPTEQDLAELRGFLAFLDGNNKVLRYSWFPSHVDIANRPPWYPADWRDMSLVDAAGNLTELGKVYAR
jgi:hypothetical protein